MAEAASAQPEAVPNPGICIETDNAVDETSLNVGWVCGLGVLFLKCWIGRS